MKFYKSLLALLLALLFSKCFLGLGPKKGIHVFNNTDSTFYIAFSFNDSLRSYWPLVYYEEVNIDNVMHKRYPCYRVEPFSKSGIGIPGRESLLLRCDDNKLRLFFILESTMQDYSWEEICKNRLYEKKLTLTEEELKENDWIVVYE